MCILESDRDDRFELVVMVEKNVLVFFLWRKLGSIGLSFGLEYFLGSFRWW